MHLIAGIQDEILRLHAMGLLERLLEDKTTRAHILWATDAYEDRGPEWRRDREITAALITGENSGVIRTRARKALEQQAARTRHHAEVFTPLAVCARMVSAMDAAWFSTGDHFPPPGAAGPIRFTKKRNWRRYVDARRLEITCGEAPYLVTRYDAATGEALPIAARVGLLDRKLRAVNENAADETEWRKWTLRAFQATYGYEFQGDNVLIARVNLLMTFEEYLYARWKRKPTAEEYRTIANVIAWNIWQMDGLTGAVPYCRDDAWREANLFEPDEPEPLLEETPLQPRCRIYDWRRKNSLDYMDVNTGGRNMKFDFIIGNPPYQEETTETASQSNGQKPQKNIFHYFQIEADKLAAKGSVLIYPGGRWIHRSGKGLRKFGLAQINDPHLKRIIFYPNSQELFPGIAIADGLTIVVKDMLKTPPEFEYVYCKQGQITSVKINSPGEELIPLNPQDSSITQKVEAFIQKYHLKYLHERILPRSLFGIESNFIENNPNEATLFLPTMHLDFSKKVKLLTNDKAGKAGRAKWFVVNREDIHSNSHLIDEWQVVVSSANAGGQKRDNQLEIIDNHSAFGRSRVALGSFKTKLEAYNFFAYVKTYIAKFMFLMTDESLSSVGKRVPDLMDYTSANPLIDFSQNLDSQLYSLIGITNSEKAYIEDRVNSIRKKEMA